MTCDEVRGRAAGLVSLPPGDPERREAEKHAEGCAGCRAALAEGRRLLSLMDRVPALAAPSAQALQRAAAPILADLAPRRRRGIALIPLVALGCWALLAAVSRQPADAQAWFESAVAAAAAALFGITAILRPRLALPVALVGAVVFALTTAAGPGAADGAQGVHCLLTEAISGVLPLGAAAALVATGRLEGGAARFAAVAAVGALAGEAGLHLACPVHSQAHLLVYHAGGVALAALIGALASRLPRMALA